MNRVQSKLIEDAETKKWFLNDWEKGFIESLRKLPPDAELTSTQNSKLNNISSRLATLE